MRNLILLVVFVIFTIWIRNVKAGGESFPWSPSSSETAVNCILNPSNGKATRMAVADCEYPCPEGKVQEVFPGFGCCCKEPESTPSSSSP
ncbi:CLUMA_CG017133, isoform A [Clunio marinus]|uniref:CLUMA_CG017133, isoform A n=1 Tax=Clunio marinus TaxID=568069 RepID=A0A1J1IV02_9DIPT|nr:CLUMA_CG017133, isoform A [Clunio marinus]